MIKLIKKIIPNKYHNSKLVSKLNCLLRNCYSENTYSQEGEDRVLTRIFERSKNGFYVDIGAHHPKRFSNTFLFYKRGWKGINIDAMPGSMRSFVKARQRDVNIEAAISNKKTEINYYSFKEAALNTINDELASKLKQSQTLIKKIKIKTQLLGEVLDKHLPNNQQIDFMTIDVEGADFAVLKSNNWDRYKPSYILIEIRKNNLEDLIDHKITQYLRERKYILFAKTVNTVFFKYSF